MKTYMVALNWLLLTGFAMAQTPLRNEGERPFVLREPALVKPVSGQSRMRQVSAQLVESELPPTADAEQSRESLPPPAPVPDGARGLELEDLERIALTENPSIGRAASLVQAARGNWVQVGLPPNPTTGYEGQQIGSRGLAEQDGVFIGQEIVRGGKLRLNREIAAQEIARASEELAAQQQRVITDVRILFYQSLIAQRQEELSDELVAISKQGQITSENLFKQREVGRLDVLQAQLEVRNASIVTVNSKNRRVSAWRSLASVIGRPNWSPQNLAGSLDEIPQHQWQESLERLLTSSPEIAIAMTNIERARWAAERARVEKTPNVTVQGLVNARDNGIGGRSDGAVQIGIPLPVWNRNQGGVIQAEHQAIAAERELQQLELSLQNRLAPVFERYGNALNQVQEYRETILPTARDSLALSRELYQAGETGFLNVLTAQRTYSQTNLAYLDALRELRTASAEIDGLLLTNSLQSGTRQ